MGRRKSSDNENKNADLCSMLEELADYEKNVHRQRFKFRAYRRAATLLAKYPKRVESGAEAKELEGVGKSTAEKIDEFLKTGRVEKLEKEVKTDETNAAMKDLVKVNGIGPAQAKNLFDEGIKSIEDLKNRQDEFPLTHHQKLGLKYYEEFKKKIPRSEMEEIEQFFVESLQDLDRKFSVITCGSYRRMSPESENIDFLVTHEDYINPRNKQKGTELLNLIVEKLTKERFLTDTIAIGGSIFKGVCKLPSRRRNQENLNRRIDIKLLPKNEYWCNVLYFTGPDEFNRQMRGRAAQKGYRLGNYNLRIRSSAGKIGRALPVKSEKDVFDYLGMEYVEPENRK